MRRFFIALKALIFMSGFVALWAWVAISIRALDRRFGILLPAWTETPGVIFMVIGGILGLLCGGVFVARGGGTPAPFDAPTEFLAAGPYRYARNPMYIGGWILLVVCFEEPQLKRRFGASYEDYCRAVPRWIPRP